MRGASALDELLSRHPDPTLRVLVVWLPVLRTDVTRPFAGVRRKLRDPRVQQFWDPDCLLSTELIAAARQHPDWLPAEDRARLMEAGAIVWDTALLFPKGSVWDGSAPRPGFYGFPVVASVEGLEAALVIRENE